MGAISSAQRDSKQDGDTVTEPSAGQDEAQESGAEDKLLQKNGQISSLNEKTESEADESKGPHEERVLAEVGSGYVTLKEDDTETTEDLQEGDTSQENTEELAKEMVNADGVAVKEDEIDDKQNDIEVGFKKIFRFVGFKFTLKKDKCDKSDTEEPLTNEQEKKAATCSEDSRDTTEDSPVSTNEQEEMQKDITGDDGQNESKESNTTPETDNETAVSQISEITENNEKITPDEEKTEEVTESPEPEEPMSPIKRFFTQGIFASLRKKRRDEAPKENKEEELKRTDKEEGEKLGEAAPEDSTCVCLDISNITPEEGRDLSKPSPERELMNSQEQEKVPASPLIRLFRKLSTRRQRETKPTETKPTETNVIEPGENLNEKLHSSTELIKVTKEEEEAKMEEPKSAGEDQITDISPEESKKKSDSTVSWESLICIGSNKRRARKTSDSEDATQDRGEEPKKTTESPLGSSTEGDYEHLTSSNEQTGSPAEEEGGSTWKSLKKLVTPKRKGRMEESGSSEQIPSDTEITKDESSCSITKLIPGRKKRKFDDRQEQTSDEAGKDAGTDNEDDETPAVVPLSEYEIIEPESLKETREETELEKRVQPTIEEDKPKETSPSVKSSYDVKPSVVPISSDYIEDLTEFISKHQQLSDIPEEGIIEESVATPVSSAEWTTQDDTLAEDFVELTADAVTAPEPGTEQFNGDETTEMVSAVSQLTESPKTSGNVTPVPLEYDMREADVIIQEVVETICMTPSVMSITSKDKDPETLAVSVSPHIVESTVTAETKILVAHEKAEATSICTGLVSQEIGDVEEVSPLALVEGISESMEAVSTELVSEDLTEGHELAGPATDDVCAAEVKEIKTELLEAFLPDKHYPPLVETEKEMEDIFQLHADLMEESRKGEVSTVEQEEEVKHDTTEAINGNQELASVQMAIISAVQGETLLLEEQVTAKNTSEVPETEGPLDMALKEMEPVHEEPAVYAKETAEVEKEQSVPHVELSTTDIEQVTLAEVVESVAQNVIVAVPDSSINKASEITEDVVQVTVVEVAETLTQNVVVSEPVTTLDEASEITEGTVEVFASTVESLETTEAISIVSPVSSSIKVVDVELEDEVQMKNVPSLCFVDNHEIQVEVKDTELGTAKTAVETVLDVATAVNVADIYDKVEEIREGVTAQQIEPITAEGNGEIFADETVHDIKVEIEPPWKENELNLAVEQDSLSSVTNDETSAVEEPQDVPEVKVDLEKEHPESDVTSVEDHKTKQSTEDEVYTVTPNEAEKQVENIQAPVIFEQTGLQEESAKEGCQPLIMDSTEGTQPDNQKTELNLDAASKEAAPESVEEATMTETKRTHMVDEAVTSGTPSEDGHTQREAMSEITSEIAKESQEIIEAAAPSLKLTQPEINTDQQQTEINTSKQEASQETESSVQICTEDKQVAQDIVEVTKTISEVAIVYVEETKQQIISSTHEGSNEIEQICEVEKGTIAKPEGQGTEISEEPVATEQHEEATSGEDKVAVTTIEAVKVEAPLIVKQEPEALVTPAMEVSEPAVMVTKDMQESSEDVRDQKADTPCVSIQELVSALEVEKAAASEMDTETPSVMEQKEEPPTTFSEAETAVSVELVTEPPVVTENQTETPAVTQPEVQTQVMNELKAEALEVTVPKVETHVVTEVKLETAVVTELEVQTPVVTSVVKELEVETPVVSSVAKNTDAKTTDLPSVIKDTEVQPVLTVSLPAVAQGTTVGEMPTQEETPTVAEILVPQLQTTVSKEEETQVEISKEKDVKVMAPVAVDVTQPKLETPKAEETIIQAAVPELEAQIPAVTSALETETLVGTCEEKNLDAQSLVVTSIKEVLEVGTTFLTSVVNEPQLKTTVIPVVRTPVVVPTIQMPEVPTVTLDIETKAETSAFYVTAPKTAAPEATEIKVETAVVPEVEVKTPAASSMVTELKVAPVKEEEKAEPATAPIIIPLTAAPEVTGVETAVVTEVEVKTPAASSVVTDLKVAPVKEEEKAEPATAPVIIPPTVAPEVTGVETVVVTEMEVKTPAASSVVTDLKVAPVKEEEKAEPATAPVIIPPTVAPEVTGVETVVVTEMEVKTPAASSVVTDLKVAPVKEEEKAEPAAAPVIDSSTATPKITGVETAVVTEVEVKTPAASSVVTELKVAPVKEEKKAEPAAAPVIIPPTVAPEVTGVETVVVTEVEVKTPAASSVITELKVAPIKEEERVEPAAAPVIDSSTATPKVTGVETAVVTEVEVKTPAASSVVTELKVAPVKEEEKAEPATAPVIIPPTVAPKVTGVETAVLTEVEVKTPAASSVVTKLKVAPIKEEEKAEPATAPVIIPPTVAPEVTGVETAVLTEVEVKTPAASSVVTELEMAPVKEEEKAEPAAAPVIIPPTLAPEVQTLTMVETPTIVPAVEKPTVVQTPTVVPMVQTLTADKTVADAETSEVKERCKEALVTTEAEPPALTEAEVKVTGATNKVTQTIQSTAESKEDAESLETVSRVPKEVVVFMAKTAEPLPDADDDVWEDAVDDIRVDDCSTAKAGV
ncbi:titin [Colossoma macropomum]|uniref:titin n=1 Tax=Colossoma macropomum TaxID=42526 RepID=UPI00186401CB|nr:titin [Colossoma macropomum]